MEDTQGLKFALFYLIFKLPLKVPLEGALNSEQAQALKFTIFLGGDLTLLDAQALKLLFFVVSSLAFHGPRRINEPVFSLYF